METQRAEKNKIPDDLRTSNVNLDPIPLDLIPEIFQGLPVKTLARFLCGSKEYASIIRNRVFAKSYLIKSSKRPQSLIFTFESKSHGKHFFFSASQPQNRGESSSSSVATYHMKCHSQPYSTVAPSVHGLICYGPPSKLMVYNPSTRRSITLPKIDSQRIDMCHFLGYDPISGDYKVLCMTRGIDLLAQELRVLTMGIGNSWRMVQDFPPHYLESPYSADICIDGVLYYVAYLERDTEMSHAVMSFNVRSEIFDLIKGLDCRYRQRPKLTSYKGKLAVMCSGFADCSANLWVLEDAAKHEWSKKYYIVPVDGMENFFMHPFCATHTGEIVFARECLDKKPFYVLYYDPWKNAVSRVYIQGISELKDPLWYKDSYHRTISVVSGQVDNLMFL